MTPLARRVAAMTGLPASAFERLAGGDLSEVLLVRRPEGEAAVAKGGPHPIVEAAMLRALAAAGMPTPEILAEHDGFLLLSYVENDRMFSPAVWSQIGGAVRRLHDRTGDAYGWPTDHALATVELDNRRSRDWPAFWGEQRLKAAASMLDRPWRERVAKAADRTGELLPAAPAPALLHGDLWSGNLLVRNGRLAAMIDPACYHGHAEVDLAMLELFDSPPEEFRAAYGPLDPGWERRRPLYQLFPALVHLRLFGAGYGGLVDRLLNALGA